MDRLGVGYDELLKENPKLVYCAISGFGQDGPLRDLPAYDQIIQGMSGIMSITGAPENAPLPRRLSGGRHDRRHHRGLRGRRRAGRPPPHRGRLHRRVDARGGDGDDGLGGVEPPDRRPRAHADGQRERDGESFGHLPDRRRPAQHRRQQAGAVRGGVPGASGDPEWIARRAVHRPPGPAAASRRAEGAAGAGDGGASRPTNGGGCSTRPACRRARSTRVPQALEHPQIARARHDRARSRTRRASAATSASCAPASSSTARRRRSTRRRRCSASTATRSSPSSATRPRRSRR